MTNKLMVLLILTTMSMTIFTSGVKEPININETEITQSKPTLRVMTGNYYDYLVVETVNGNEWLLDNSKESKYIENDMAVFEDGELVQVVFNTKGTDNIKDTIVIEVRSIDSRY